MHSFKKMRPRAALLGLLVRDRPWMVLFRLRNPFLKRGEVNEGTTTLVDLPAVPKRQEDAAQAAAVRGEHCLGDAAEREH